eukprot:COSAG01_NODE_3594_length_5897_cov_18.786651_3_plen_312_part_00
MQVCAYRVSELRKAVTRMRKRMRITGPKGSVQLKELLVQHGGVQETEGSVSALRKRWTAVSRREHPAVSKMSAKQVIQYMYKFADEPFNWDWTTVIKDGKKSRVSKSCRKAPGTGEVSEAPRGALPKSKDADDDLVLPRKLSAYQIHMKQTLAELKSSEPELTAKERFTEAVRRWNRDKRISADKAQRRRARERRKANPLAPAPNEPIEFQTAPRKRTAAASRASAPSRIGKLQSLTTAQKRQIDSYSPRRNRQRLKQAVRMHMQRGYSFAEARKRAENPMGVSVGTRQEFADDIAGSGAPKKKPLSMADV